MSNLYRGQPIDDTYQVSVHMAQRFQRRRFLRNQPIRNKNCLWQPCLLTDRDEMSNLYRGLSKVASYQVSIHLAKRFQRRRILKFSQLETRVACGGHVCKRIGTKWAIFTEDLPYMLPIKFRFIWPSGFRGEDLKKSANQKQELPVAAMFVNGSGRN
jgi:hypothetical protein